MTRNVMFIGGPKDREVLEVPDTTWNFHQGWDKLDYEFRYDLRLFFGKWFGFVNDPKLVSSFIQFNLGDFIEPIIIMAVNDVVQSGAILETIHITKDNDHVRVYGLVEMKE